MAEIVLDTTRFPLVVSRFPARWSGEEIDDYFRRFAQLHNREQPFLHISDISAAENMSSSGMRRKAADFMAQEEARSARLCKGAVQVAPGRLARGAITAIHWLSPPPYPHGVVASFDEALEWARARAVEAGLSFD